MAWYIWIGNPLLATGIASFILHETVYFGRCIPWIIIDAIPYFRKWKLQPGKVPTPQEQWDRKHSILLFHPVAESFAMSTWQVPFPSWEDMLPQLAFFFLRTCSTIHYFSHQLLHTPLLYKYIHQFHHKYSAPFGLAAEYAHPLEVMILGTGTIVGPLLYCWFKPNLHIITVYIWITLRLFQAIDAHSGYDFPWSLQHIVPFWSGAEHHDFHHMAFVNNFSTSFRWWDRILGTDDKYRTYRERMRAATKGLDPTHRKAIE
ncbi:hypothetical protein F5148DRAFT_1276568 [Russula earlei]|uniref:Uncharacterized protein n=1 Tax=Russula earlei TaxID=71964 RepID=A0ACC0U535_9AGAM|nr:hypothetical protein F5148DRAFT_1276568 [Russula earlei]